MKKIIAGLIAGVLAFSLTACGKKSDDSNKIKIAYLPITHSLAVLETADEFAEKTGLQVELVKYGSWNELMDALNSGRVDGASVLIELAMKSKEQGIDLKAVALGHIDGNVIITSNDIQSAEDLKEKQLLFHTDSHRITFC